MSGYGQVFRRYILVIRMLALRTDDRNYVIAVRVFHVRLWLRTRVLTRVSFGALGLPTVQGISAREMFVTLIFDMDPGSHRCASKP